MNGLSAGGCFACGYQGTGKYGFIVDAMACNGGKYTFSLVADLPIQA